VIGIWINVIAIRCSGGLLMSGRRPDCELGDPDLWSKGSVCMGPSKPISIDPSAHIPLQQTTDRSRFLRSSSNTISANFVLTEFYEVRRTNGVLTWPS
jgi:hypothetical protein